MEGTPANAESIRKHVTAQAMTSESKPSASKKAVSPAPELKNTQGRVDDELDKPLALTDVIEKLSYEQYPEYVRKNDSTLTFPEKLMLMLIHVERVYAKQGKKLEDQSIGWSNDGKSFVIRDKDALCKSWVPAFFGQAKFSSFTRKLYRWGFRKVNVSINDRGEQIVVFSNENFQRDDVSRLSTMQSITAAKVRNQLAVKSGPQKEATPGRTSVGVSEIASEQPSVLEHLLRERISASGSERLASPSLLQYQQQREQEILRNRGLLASQLNIARFSSSNLPTMHETSLLGRQQAVLNRYRQSPFAPPTTSTSTMELGLAARSQLENLRLLEALERQRTAGMGSLNNDGSLEQLLLQRQLRAAQVPSVDHTTIMQSMDGYALLRRELENNLLGQNIRVASLQQQLENRGADNMDRQYLAALAAILQQRNNR